MEIKKNILAIRQNLPAQCRLVAVSKTKPSDIIQEAYEAGQRDFGENKAQELAMKAEVLPNDIQWHMIGHLQTNKVKYIAPFVHLIHSVDSLKVLVEINKQGQKTGRTINCLLQVHIADEETKFGFSESEIIQLLKDDTLNAMKNIGIIGLMGMATFTENTDQVRKEFRSLKQLFERLKTEELPDMVSMKELSMGMSGDYTIALEEGSTMVRIGSALFGERQYNAY
jgi:PLP dependent protein